MAGGITFGIARPELALVVANGVCAEDSRVIKRTNEATLAILSELTPVNGMMTVDVVASGTTLLLPAEMENAIEVEVQGMGQVNSSGDVTQGWYDIVNPFTYVDPSAQHDNPLVDEYLQPDPVTPTILRRQYDYPGLTANATVRVTGAKRYRPITADADYLIVQNVLALKYAIQMIEEGENGNPTQSEFFHKKWMDLLTAEVKKHLLDPRQSMKRKAAYDADLATYPQDTFGWTRARLAFELPGGLTMGKSELTRLLDMSEMKLISRGQWVGTLQEYTAEVIGGHILCPLMVQTIVAIDLCCQPIDIKNVFFEYQKNGTGKGCGCHPSLIDEGDMLYPNGDRRRQYKLKSSSATQVISFVGKLRWIKKAPADFMTVKNFEALRLMCQAIMDQRNEKWTEAQAAEANAIREVERELSEYLAGQMMTAPVNFGNDYRRGGLL